MGKALVINIGEKFGRLTAISEPKATGRSRTLMCRCECGNELEARASALKSGNTKSCGCIKIKQEEGNKYGRLLVLKMVGLDKQYSCIFSCLCDCGKITTVSGLNLRDGSTRSCGCLRKEACDQTTHGMSKTTEYHSYVSAKGRCTNTNNAKFFDYGGRGVEFRFFSFEQFFKELGPKPKGTSLDRKDNEGHYEPGNVKWSTPIEQMANRRGFSKDRINCEVLVAYAKQVMGEYTT